MDNITCYSKIDRLKEKKLLFMVSPSRLLRIAATYAAKYFGDDIGLQLKFACLPKSLSNSPTPFDYWEPHILFGQEP